MAFTAKFADYNFCFGKGCEYRKPSPPTVERLEKATAMRPECVPSVGAFHVIIADDTMRRQGPLGSPYKDGVDERGVAWLGQQGAADNQSQGRHHIRSDGISYRLRSISNMGTWSDYESGCPACRRDCGK